MIRRHNRPTSFQRQTLCYSLTRVGQLYEALQTSTGGVYVPAYPNWNEQLDLVLEQVWAGELTPQEALDQAQAGVEAAAP